MLVLRRCGLRISFLISSGQLSERSSSVRVKLPVKGAGAATGTAAMAGGMRTWAGCGAGAGCGLAGEDWLGVVENLNGGRLAAWLPLPLTGVVGTGGLAGGVLGAMGVKAMGGVGVTCRWLNEKTSVSPLGVTARWVAVAAGGVAAGGLKAMG